jgi:tetratricopeptide (TPR) repeat protein
VNGSSPACSGLGEANALKSPGDAASEQAHCEEAQALYEQALAVYGRIGDRRGEANGLQSLGDAALRLRRFDEAKGTYNQALPM